MWTVALVLNLTIDNLVWCAAEGDGYAVELAWNSGLVAGGSECGHCLLRVFQSPLDV
ncbi:hypothetical protein CsSME_00048528 [Camellia sinensis var. sinensis]